MAFHIEEQAPRNTPKENLEWLAVKLDAMLQREDVMDMNELRIVVGWLERFALRRSNITNPMQDPNVISLAMPTLHGGSDPRHEDNRDGYRFVLDVPSRPGLLNAAMQVTLEKKTAYLNVTSSRTEGQQRQQRLQFMWPTFSILDVHERHYAFMR